MSAIGLLIAAWIVPGAHVNGFWAALLAAAVIASAQRDPAAARRGDPAAADALFGFLAILVLDALMLLAADAPHRRRLSVDWFWSALLVAFVAVGGRRRDRGRRSARTTTTAYSFRVVQRIARRPGRPGPTDAPGIVFLEIDGLALPVLQPGDAGRQRPARWRAGSPRTATRCAAGRPTSRRRPARARRGSCSARTTTSPRSAGSRRRPRRSMSCSAPADCAEIERRHATRQGPPLDGGASRGNLLSGRGRPRDPHGQPDRGREAREPRLPHVLRQRLQRHARARAVRRGRCSSSGRRRSRAAAATCGRAGTGAASTRSCARRCASSCAT